MKVQNMTSSNGNPVENQFILTGTDSEGYECDILQSYDSIIAKRQYVNHYDSCVITLDRRFWDYSRTTGKYRNQFLGETKAETQKKIDSGEYKLVNLN